MNNLYVRLFWISICVICIGASIVSAQTLSKGDAPFDIGLLNGKAKTLVQPVYPAAAAEKGVAGAVTLKLIIDEKGNVISADVVSGDPLLTGAAIVAASKSTFSPYTVNGKARKMTGTLVYNFTAPAKKEQDFNDLLNNLGSLGDFNMRRLQAELAIDDGKYDEAIDSLSREIKGDPKDALSLADRALAYYFKKDLGNALADANNALAVRSRLPLALTVRALVERARSQTAIARRDFDLALEGAAEAIAKSPDTANPYISRADIYRLKGDRDLALADYRKAIELNPGGRDYPQKRIDSLLAETSGGKQGSDPRYTQAVTQIDNLLLDFDQKFAKLKKEIKDQESAKVKDGQYQARCQAFGELNEILKKVKVLIARMKTDNLPFYEAGDEKQKAKSSEWLSSFSKQGCFMV